MKPFKGRREDARLLTGRGQYTADCNLPNQLHAFFLRSDRAHAELVRIDRSPALRLPGVKHVLIGDDLAGQGFRTLPSLITFPGRNGFRLHTPERLPLAHRRARFACFLDRKGHRPGLYPAVEGCQNWLPATPGV